MIDVIGLTALTEGQPKPHRRRNESTCGAPVARFGVWVGPFGEDLVRRKRIA